MTPLRIGTRGSKLALWQANTVARLLKESGGHDSEIIVIRTSGDEGSSPPDPPPSTDAAPNIKRMFVKEIEEALLTGQIDVAVHSSKDLPGQLPDGLIIGAALEREDPRDALLLPHGPATDDFAVVKKSLGTAPRIGTSSVRRVAQLRAAFPEATFAGIRGNVDTRLRKLDAGECDALVLAAAGVKRLGLAKRLTSLVPVDVCVPAPGQGIVAVQIREDASVVTKSAVTAISDADAESALLAERAVVIALGGGCQMPLGALARLDGQELLIHGIVASLDGKTVLRGVARGTRGGAAAIGEKLAAQLLAKGAGELLQASR